MTLDPYSLCPGGTGKKIKFCCTDLLHDLDKVQRMIEGEQRIAALDYVAKLDAKYPGRACLLSFRSLLETMLNKRDEAAATLARFREKEPDNPLALAHAAVLAASGERPAEAIAPLLRAIVLSDQNMSGNVYQAIGMVGGMLAELGEFIPARALLVMQSHLSRGEDKNALAAWASLDGNPDIPVLLKDDAELAPAPPNAPWKYEFGVALDRAKNLDWQMAAEKFAALIPLAGSSPALWHNLAWLRGRLGDYRGTIDALRALSALDIPLDDAVEAEAKALLLEMMLQLKSPAPPPPGPSDRMLVAWPVLDQDRLAERLAADRTLDHIDADPRAWASMRMSETPDEPLPRAIYLLLDRPIPAADGLTVDKVPCVLGYVAFFGRQTDRAERLEFFGQRSELEAVKALLKRIGGDALGAPEAEEVIVAQPNSDGALAWQWRFPDGVPGDVRSKLLREEKRRRLCEVWPDVPHNLLEGKTPRQAAADPRLRRRVLGQILVNETDDAPDLDAEAFNELRRRLGLPVAGPIDPATIDLMHLPAVRLERLQLESLTPAALVSQYRRASMLGMRRTLARLAAEVVGRPDLGELVDVAQAHGILAAMAPDTAVSLAQVERARSAAIRAKQSTAPWDLQELDLRIHRGEATEASRLLQHIRDEHSREPGVSEALFGILHSAGIIDEQGRMLGPAPAERSPLVVPAAAEPGKLLVPGGADAPARGEGAAKPVIWTPGME